MISEEVWAGVDKEAVERDARNLFYRSTCNYAYGNGECCMRWQDVGHDIREGWRKEVIRLHAERKPAAR